MKQLRLNVHWRQLMLAAGALGLTAVSTAGVVQHAALPASIPAVCWQAAETYTVVALDPVASERWPRPVTFAIRRTQTTAADTVEIALSGTATIGVDYRATPTTSVTFPVGIREVWVTVQPISDANVEPDETITLSLTGRPGSATITLANYSSTPTEEEATRFLIQAAFGADKETLAEVRRMGVLNWITAQIKRPKSYLQPIIIAKRATGAGIGHPDTKVALWTQVMRPLKEGGDPSTLPDPLRHRVAYSLMQIFVVSQNIDALLLNSEGVTHYYDRLMDGAFGNFRDLLRDVTLHPCMGVYLSHLQNQKADPSKNRYPDENFAREVMQLFTIGLWELNQDGTQKLVDGKPVPTYNQSTIREYARVFTGLNYGGPNNNQFDWSGWDFVHPMKMWDSHHDMAPKRLINGVVTPARTPEAIDKGAGAYADLELAIDSLFHHPNVGPFIGKLLIQRLVTSNPSPAYVSRVAAKFNNNGKGVRGDMAAVVTAILMDTEARSYSVTRLPAFGKKREPYLTLFNLTKTFDARPESGKYDDATYMYDFMLQEPFQSPSVFNFYLPSYRPSGRMTAENLRGPEFQIMTAVTARGALNILNKTINQYLAHWGSEPPNQIKLKFPELTAIANDPDALVKRASARLLDRPLRPRTFQIIREAIAKVTASNDSNWQETRVRMTLYLIVSTPEFQIQK